MNFLTTAFTFCSRFIVTSVDQPPSRISLKLMSATDSEQFDFKLFFGER
jgi:hypothetical protein